MKENIKKQPPKSKVKFTITLSEEQKLAKAKILTHPYTFITGKAGSGKCITYESEIDIKIDDKFYEFLVQNNYLNKVKNTAKIG